RRRRARRGRCRRASPRRGRARGRGRRCPSRESEGQLPLDRVWDELLLEDEPGVAWYRELESSPRSEYDDDDDELEVPVVPEAPVDVLVVKAMIDPKPTKAARLMAVTMRARRAGCRRRRRGRGVPSAGTRTSLTDTSARSLNTAPVPVLRDPWAGS